MTGLEQGEESEEGHGEEYRAQHLALSRTSHEVTGEGKPSSSTVNGSPVIVLRTLGDVKLEGGSASLAGRRRELTLAAFIARRAPQPCYRTELASLLWESRDDARARQSLRQALLELKRVLGDAIRIEGDQVLVDRALLTLDVADFERALDEGRESDAVALWHGDFLAGMDDVGGEAFRSWLETHRESLRRRARTAFGTLTNRAGTSDDWLVAVRWAGQWADAFPLEEAGNRSLIEALHHAGRSAEALGRAEAFAARLKSELDDVPSPELTRLHERIIREAQGRRAPGSAALFSPDLTGRDPVVAGLIRAWDEARAGAAVVVLLEGEPGFGKTRVAEELLRAVGERADPVVLLRMTGSELPAGEAVPLGAARALFADLAEAPGVAGAAPRSVAAMGLLVPAIGRRFPPTADAAPLEEAVTEVLAAVGEERPVLLLLDDVDLMDEATQRLLGRVVPALRAPVLVLAMTNGMAGASPALDGLRAVPTLRRLKLQPLTIPDIESMLASMLQLDAADQRQLATRLYAEGGGNPFYVIEMTSTLVDEGVLVTAPDGGWRLTPGEGWSLPLPSSLRAAITRRLDRLGPGPRAVADAAAVLGHRFDRTVLALVAGLEPAALDQALDGLIAGRLVREAPVVGTSSELEFRHALTARCAYDRIPLGERARLHASATKAFEKIGPAVPAAHEAARYHRVRSRPARRYWPWIAAAVVLVVAGAVALTRRRSNLGVNPARVVVASFENQTGDSTLNAAGQFIADWITQGIAQSEIVPVVDVRTALTSERIVGADTAKRGITKLRALALEAAAGRVVWGTYYFRGDSLVLQANISDAGSGQILRALDPVAVVPRDPSRAVEQASQGVLGALALLYGAHGNDLLAGVRRPPLYPAYRTFMEAMDLLVQSRSAEAGARFAQAYLLDTTFTQALVWEADAYEQMARWPDADSVLRLAARSRNRLGPYEQVFLDYRRAELAGDFARALDQARELARIAPGSEATFLLGAMAIRLNRPNEALRALAQVDPEKGFLRGWDGFWGYPMQANLMLGNLERALDAAREGRRRYPTSRQAVHQEVTVLSAMGREAEVNRLLDVEDGLPETPGLPLQRTIRGAATMFRAFGFDSAARRMAERAISLLPNRDSTAAGDERRLLLVEALYLVDRYAEARPIVAAMARRAPNDLTWQGYTGLLAARLGDRAEADRIMRNMADDRRPYAFGRGALWRARIEAALGQDQQAISMLRTGLAQGLTFDQAYINMMPDFRGLEKYPEYRELFRPKG